MKRSLIVCTLALCLSAAAACCPAGDKEAAQLDGTWKIVSIEAGGQMVELSEDVRVTIDKEKVLYGGEPLAKLTSYPAAMPPGIDFTFDDPQRDYEGIYALDGGQLRICLNTRTEGIKERPADFETKDKADHRVFVLQRLSPAEAGAEVRKGFVGMALAREGDAVIISEVLKKSPAEKAGLKAGDVLLQIAGHRITELQATVDLIRRETPGTELAIEVYRDGARKEIIKVKVGVFPFSLLGLLG
jgi:uncharacterized protein (TIGR03067 family)